MPVSLPESFHFREMNSVDVSAVLQIIRRHNEDDFEAASESYARSLNGQFVLTRDNSVIGATGARAIPGTDKSFWLSWTYLDPTASLAFPDPTLIFELVCEKLKERANARKLFAMISPTVDSGLGGGHSYGGALDSYLEFGFETELTHSDYYAAGESMTLLSHRLRSPGSRSSSPPMENRSISILDADEIPETDDAYFLEWDFANSPPVDQQAVPYWLEAIRQWEGRVVLIGIPGNANRAMEQLCQAGFRKDGVITDFFADGLDEVRLRFDL